MDKVGVRPQHVMKARSVWSEPGIRVERGSVPSDALA
jgi:hypothetical protein